MSNSALISQTEGLAPTTYKTVLKEFGGLDREAVKAVLEDDLYKVRPASYNPDVWPEDAPDMTTEGVKFDDGKLPYHLLPPELLEGVASVLDFGARKYSARNWELGMDWSRPFGALMRHMWAWWRKEEADPETGMSHLWHAGCCLAFLIAYEQRKVGTDDRPQ